MNTDPMTAPDRPLVGEDRIEAIMQQARSQGGTHRGPHEAMEWAIRQAIKEAGEAAAKEAENSVAHLADHAKVSSSERSIGALWAADKIASAIRQRLPAKE